jgi:hypothetical protein
LNCARLATGPWVVAVERGSPTTNAEAAFAREPLDLREAFARHDHAGGRAARLADAGMPAATAPVWRVRNRHPAE